MAIRKRAPVAAEPTVAWPPPTDPLADPLVAPPFDTAVAPVPPAAVPAAEVADNRFGLGLLIGLLVLLAVGGVIAAILLTRHHHQTAAPVTTTVVVNKPSGPASVVVPRFIGQPKQAAASALRSQGFTVRFATVPGPAPAGAVVGQQPAPQARVAPHSVVTLQLSNGAAGAAPTQSISTVTVTTSPAAATTAPAAAPTSATSTAATTTTTATAPAQPATASVPDVAGNQVQSAAQSLGATGFPVSIAYVPSSEPLGTVVAQSPSPGTSEPTTTHVTINASSGPGQKPQETVPDATGKTIPDAVSALNAAGLRLFLLRKPICDRSLAGKVVEQTPAAGKTAPHNAQVLVYMGAFQSTNC